MFGETLRREEPPTPLERGETLVEVLATVVMLGLSVTAVVAMIFTVIRVQHTYRRDTTANTTLVDFAEAIRLSEGTNAYVNCAGVSTYTYAGAPTGYQATVVSVERLASASSATASWVDTQSAGCDSSDDGGVQRIRLRVTSPANPQATESMYVIKRNPKCASSAALTC